MKANELRIGNLVQNFLGEIKSIVIQDLQIIVNNNYEFKPIPLTEEWLLKFGFEEAMNGWWCPYEVISYEGGFVGFGTDRFTMVKYVHELQNYYFAVTGSELTIKN